MIEDFFYKEKGLFLQTLHPVSALVYVGVIFILALMFTNPLYLIGLLICIGLAILAVGGFSIWEFYLRGIIYMMIPIIVLNPLISRMGDTILWMGPTIPVYGRLIITLESIFFSLVMSIRLLDVVSIFCLYNIMIHPDKVLNIFSRVTFKSALILSIATRMFPAMIKQLANIKEVQVVRGVDFETGTLKERLKKYTGLINILVLSSLEDAMEMAEAMQARAYGSGKRTCYYKDLFRPRDTLCLVSSLMALLFSIYGQIKGFIVFEFYPRTGQIIKGPETVWMLAIILVLLLVPLILNWGWLHCPHFSSKI